jgi:Protein of unknown function (DUF3467)
MDEEQKKPEQPVKFEWVKGKERTPEIYCNYVNASWTLYDVRVVLGQLVPRDNGENAGFVIEERGAVTVAWPEAKVLRNALIDLVDKYEKTNGEIVPLKLPPPTP